MTLHPRSCSPSRPTPTHSDRRRRAAVAKLAAGLALGLGTLLPAVASAGLRLEVCGGNNEVPCNIWQAFPSCDTDLEENFLTRKCVSPTGSGGGSGSSGCGTEGNRPCKIWESFPSCDDGLVENFLTDTCVDPFVPPSVNCGGQDQVACTVLQRIPSCKGDDLAEDFGNPSRCRKINLSTEWSPFMAGLGNLNKRFQAELGNLKQMCRAAMTPLVQNHQTPPFIARMPGLQSGITAQGDCPGFIGAGFICEAPALLELFQIPNAPDMLTAMEDEFHAQFGRKPCADIADPGARAACAAGQVIFSFVMPGGYAAAQCFSRAVGSEAVWKALSPGQVSLSNDKCMDIGAMMFELGMMAIENKGKVNDGSPNKQGVKNKLKSRSDGKFANAPASARATLEQNRAQQKVDNGNIVENLLSMVGNADAVAGVLAGIPECNNDPAAPDAPPSVPSVLGVALKASSGHYVAAEDFGPVNVNRAEALGWETWALVPLGGATYALRSYHGHYLGYTNSSTNAVQNANAIGPWEKFELVNLPNGKTAFKILANGKYLHAVGNGGSALHTDGASAGTAESFAVVNKGARVGVPELCTPGGPLERGAGAGVAKVCVADPYCCDTAWDASCVKLMATVAGQACFGPYTPGTCQAMSDTYGITHGVTWGEAPPSVQSQWIAMNCNTSPALSTCQSLSDRYGITPTSSGDAPPNIQAYYRTWGCNTRPLSWSACKALSNDYGISDVTWGWATPSAKDRWIFMGCSPPSEAGQDPCQRASNLYGIDHGVTSGFASWQLRDFWSPNGRGCATHPQGDLACKAASDAYGMEHGATYGYAPQHVLDWWLQKGCTTEPTIDPDARRTTCQLFSNVYGIDHGRSWGLSPLNIRSWWMSHGCDTRPQSPNSACQQVSDEYGLEHGVTWGIAPQVVQEWWQSRGCDTVPNTTRLCQRLSDKYGIQGYVTWGFAPQAAQDLWQAHDCEGRPNVANLCQAASNQYGIADGTPGFAPQHVQTWWTQNGCHTTPNLSVTCKLASDEYGIDGASFGYAPENVKSWWTSVGCQGSQPTFADSCQVYRNAHGIGAHGENLGAAPQGVQTAWAALGCNEDTGDRPENAGTSCKAIHAAYPDLPSARYWLDPAGGSSDDAFNVYCDMVSDGGGWVKVLQAAGTPWVPTVNAAGDPASATVDAFAKLSDAQINAIGAAGAMKTYRLKGSQTNKALYFKTNRAYDDGAWAMNLVRGDVAVPACEATSLAGCSMTNVFWPTLDSFQWGLPEVGLSSCDRYYVDFANNPMCGGSNTSQRCFATGHECNGGAVIIPSAVLWVRE